jgi:hypothetical protein
MNRTSRTSRVWALALLGVIAAGPGTAMASTSFEFLFSTGRVTDDHQLFLNLAVTNSGFPRAEIEPVLPRIQYVEMDLPVVLFVAQQCGRPPDYVVNLRAQGLSWSVIFTQLNISPQVLFAGIDQDPGPPYGKAWGYWRKNPSSLTLNDEDIRGLVEIQMGSRWAGSSPYELARARSQGKSVVTLVADKHGRPYHGGGADKGEKGKGHGKDHGHGHGNDNG